MKLAEQIKLHKELSEKIAELEEKKQILGISILQQMQSKILHVPGFLVRQFTRLSINTSIEEARALKATKVGEVIDKEKIKDLYSKGEPISGINEVRYIQISEK